MTAISLDQSPIVLQMTPDVLGPSADKPEMPWLVDAAAQVLESVPPDPNARIVVLTAIGCPHVQGLSVWTVVLGPGSSRILSGLRDTVAAAGLPAQLESAPLGEYPFLPLLLRQDSGLSLLFPKGGGPGLNDWVLGMGDMEDAVEVAAKIGERFSFRDFHIIPGGFALEPL